MKRIVVSILAGILIAGMAGAAGEDAAKAKPQKHCPVMGSRIDKSLYVDVDGKRVYVCCEDCVAAVTKDPAKYVQKLEAEGVTLATVQTTCPVMGGKIDKSLYVDHDGKRIYVCCSGCIGAIKADPQKYIKQLEDAGIVLDAAGK